MRTLSSVATVMDSEMPSEPRESSASPLGGVSWWDTAKEGLPWSWDHHAVRIRTRGCPWLLATRVGDPTPNGTSTEETNRGKERGQDGDCLNLLGHINGRIDPLVSRDN